MNHLPDNRTLNRFLEKATRFLFFTGKGGAGKTSLCYAAAGGAVMQRAGHWAADWSLRTKRDKMNNEQKTKKGFFGMLRESFSKTSGCCCGPGETCSGPSEQGKKAQTKGTGKTKAASQTASN